MMQVYSILLITIWQGSSLAIGLNGQAHAAGQGHVLGRQGGQQPRERVDGQGLMVRSNSTAEALQQLFRLARLRVAKAVL